MTNIKLFLKKKEKSRFIYTSEYNKPVALAEKKVRYTPKIPNNIPPTVEFKLLIKPTTNNKTIMIITTNKMNAMSFPNPTLEISPIASPIDNA